MAKNPKIKPEVEMVAALRFSFRRKLWAEWCAGTSMPRLKRKYSLTQLVVEQIIREQLK